MVHFAHRARFVQIVEERGSVEIFSVGVLMFILIGGVGIVGGGKELGQKIVFFGELLFPVELMVLGECLVGVGVFKVWLLHNLLSFYIVKMNG